MLPLNHEIGRKIVHFMKSAVGTVTEFNSFKKIILSDFVGVAFYTPFSSTIEQGSNK